MFAQSSCTCITRCILCDAGGNSIQQVPPPPPPPPPPASEQATVLNMSAARSDGGSSIQQAALFRDIKRHGQSDQHSPRSSRSFDEPPVNSRQQLLLDLQRSATKRRSTSQTNGDDYADPHSRATGVNSRELMLLEIGRHRRDDDNEDGEAEYEDPHAGLNSREMMLLEIQRRAGERLAREEQNDQRRQHSYDDQTRLLPLQPASTEKKISPRSQRVSPTSTQQNDFEFYGGEASPGYGSLQVIVRFLPAIGFHTFRCHVFVCAAAVCD